MALSDIFNEINTGLCYGLFDPKTSYYSTTVEHYNNSMHAIFNLFDRLETKPKNSRNGLNSPRYNLSWFATAISKLAEVQTEINKIDADINVRENEIKIIKYELGIE